MEYPKALYRSGWDDLSDSVIVLNAAEEAHARKEGFRMLSEPAGAEPEKPKRGRKPKAE